MVAQEVDAARRKPSEAALWVGDSFTAGEAGGVPAALTYPLLVSARLGWACHVDAQNGTGFVNDGSAASFSSAPLIRRLPTDVRRYPADVVIVDAGRNDAEASTPALREAITQYLSAVRTAYPAALLVLVLPSLVDHDQPPDYQRVGMLLREAAGGYRAVVIDPAGAGAFEDRARNSRLVCPDGFHPNVEGQARYAEVLTLLLRGELE